MNPLLRLRRSIEQFGRFCLLSWDVLRRSFLMPLLGVLPDTSKLNHQMYRMGVGSVPIVALISVFIGVILSLQTAYQLEKFGATMYVSSLVSVSIVRELGPLLTAILVAGRIGAGITAELGSMVVANEITALRTMAINPRQYLLVPRNVALLVCLPALTLMADALACAGGMGVSWAFLGIPVGQFYRIGLDALVMRDFVAGFVKSVVFALIIALISCFKGFTVTGGATGVGQSTTSTVVLSIVFIILADLVFTVLFFSV